MVQSQRSDGELPVHKCCSNHSWHWYKGYTISNGYIASPWRSAMWRCYDISTKFLFCKFSLYEVPYGPFCNFSIFSIFLLSFLSFFPVIFVSLFLFPFWFLSSFGIVTSYSWDSFLIFKGNTYFLSGVGALVFCESSWVLSTLESKSNSFDMFCYF